MPEFDKNAAYLWAIIGLGVGIPVLLTLYAWLRAKLTKAKLIEKVCVFAKDNQEILQPTT
ncbi:MAG: hypothetical protein VXW22_13225 [Pseudomonadota bacterium]|nr:hypothetical protein [Pseudomonadota bacterium]